MARQRHTKDDGPPNNAWLVTFSDCMTLLLCFFVLLLSFSSFDEAAKAQLTGALDFKMMTSFRKNTREPKDSLVEPLAKPFDRTEKGSEAPTDKLEMVENPKEPIASAENDAYRDRRVFFVPISTMFWGKGSSLKASGQDYLRLIARFMKAIPCYIVIGQSDGWEEQADRGIALQRACAVIRFLTSQAGVDSNRFTIAASPSRESGRFKKPVMEIALLARNLCE